MKNVYYWGFIAGMVFLAASCAPSSKFNTLKEESDKKIERMKQEKLELKTTNNELEYALESHSNKLQDLKHDMLMLGRKLRSVKKEYRQLESKHKLLQQEHNALKSGKSQRNAGGTARAANIKKRFAGARRPAQRNGA
ncbi:MAG: hypothetical protein U5L09_17790 [Bacteroidales bacterium]|nr:hypothetical protein [Bacteroidales bacterium]